MLGLPTPSAHHHAVGSRGEETAPLTGGPHSGQLMARSVPAQPKGRTPISA